MPEDKPEVIELRRYREARRASAKVAARKVVTRGPGSTNREPLIGSRKHARLILIAAAVVGCALWLGPKLL